MRTTLFSSFVKISLIVISSLLLLNSNVLAGADLNNQTKLFTPNSEMHPTDWANSDELQRTWEAALVRIPTNHQIYAGQISDLSLKTLPVKKKLPTIIYLHG